MANLQPQRRWRLPLELQCEVISALPFQHGRRMLLLCDPINTNCIRLVRKQKGQFENQLDLTAFHEGFTLTGPNRLVVQHNGEEHDCISVLAEKSISKTPYFEVKVLEKKGGIGVGLASPRMPLNGLVGAEEGTYAYESRGNLWGHEVAGCSHIANGRPYIRGKPSFYVGDVVGCGVNFANRKIIYTLNGKRLDTAKLFVDSAADLFPCVTLVGPGTKLEVNFGPNFQINIVDKALRAELEQQQLNIVELRKSLAVFREIGLINQWDPKACHYKLALYEPDRLIVQHNGKKGWSSAVRAEKPLFEMPYFEVKVLEKKGNILIGLASRHMPSNRLIGHYDGTYAYTSLGNLWGHEAEGCSHIANGRPYIRGKPLFGVGDVVGCGVNLKNRHIIYTLNGKHLDTANLFVDSAADLFPCVSLARRGIKIKTNFGPDFEYKF